MAEDNADTSLIIVSVIENLVSQIGESLKNLNTNTAERYNQKLKTTKAVKSLQIVEIYELRKEFENED